MPPTGWAPLPITSEPADLTRRLSVPEGTPYLVYDITYDWQPSQTRELPADDWHPPMQGEWVVTDDEGKVLDRFRNRNKQS